MNVKTSEHKWAKFSHNGTTDKSRPKNGTSIKYSITTKKSFLRDPKSVSTEFWGKILFWNGRIWNPPLPKFAVSYLYFTAVQTVPTLKYCWREMSGGVVLVSKRWCSDNSYSVAGHIYSLCSHIWPARIVVPYIKNGAIHILWLYEIYFSYFVFHFWCELRL